MNLETEIDQLINIALAEDIRSGDMTTKTCIPNSAQASGKFILKQAGIIAGLPLLEPLFKKIDPLINISLLVKEGSFQKAGTIIATISGPLQGVITGERVALNFLQHTSGIATITATYVKKIAGLPCVILDTRKTLPGLRALEKYAVRIGGGHNHRFGLDDRCIIKTNHLSFVVTTHHPKPISQAVNNIRSCYPDVPIEIEVENISQLQDSLQTEAVAIMLRNMFPEEVRKCVEKIRKTSKKVYIESAGAITLDTIRAYAETGVDGISVGALTHSVQALDIRLRL